MQKWKIKTCKTDFIFITFSNNGLDGMDLEKTLKMIDFVWHIEDDREEF